MNPISRRRFFSTMAVLGASAVVASCTANSDSRGGNAASGSNSSESAAEQILRVGALGKAASAQRDPYKLLTNDSDMLICSLIWEPLTVPGENQIVAPRLMKSWKQLSPTQWELTIADNATFHDGSPVTSDDVV